MGLTNVTAEVANISSRKKLQPLDFLVDSGALFTVLPRKAWRSLKIKPESRESFSLADGTVIKREIGHAHIRFKARDGICKVILGEEDDYPLLGVTTLETLGLVLDPLKRRVLEARMML